MPGGGGIRSVALFCAASGEVAQSYRDAAAAFGEGCARHGLRMVYGGSNVGLMGAAAEAALSAGGEVMGVLPERLIRNERAHRGITELVIVETLAERKAMMMEVADAFVALPGGIGTLDEFVHMLLGKDLGQLRKPLLLCDVDGFWAPLIALFRHFDATGMLRPAVRDAFAVVPDVPAVFRELAEHRPAA